MRTAKILSIVSGVMCMLGLTGIDGAEYMGTLDTQMLFIVCSGIACIAFAALYEKCNNSNH